MFPKRYWPEVLVIAREKVSECGFVFFHCFFLLGRLAACGSWRADDIAGRGLHSFGGTKGLLLLFRHEHLSSVSARLQSKTERMRNG